MMMWFERFSVAGKRVLLTGAAGTIGLALSRAFLEAGAVVYAISRRENTEWKSLDTRFAGAMFPLRCDLADTGQTLRLAGQLEDDLGGVDVLINNASDCPHGGTNVYSLATLRATMAVTLEAAYLLCGEIAPAMARRGQGSIINITTMNAERAWPGNPSYITAKSGLRMLTKAVARDFGEHGVRANNLCPGYVHSKLTEGSFSNPDQHEERRRHTMLGRWGTPDDLVGPCLFLASDAAKYVTGLDLHVDGGWLTKGM
jgi:NAD(P)-dependent dehydrogenase (short-subunit alcohol dehydrogenase family)